MDPAVTTKDVYAMAPNQSVLPFPTPLGSHGYTLVTKYDVMDPKLAPLATSSTINPVQRTVETQNALASLKRPSTFAAQNPCISGKMDTLTIPKTIGHREHKPKESPKPVIVFREVIELPHWNKGSLDAICQLIENFTMSQVENADASLVRSTYFQSSALLSPTKHSSVTQARFQQVMDKRTQEEKASAHALVDLVKQLRMHRNHLMADILEDLDEQNQSNKGKSNSPESDGPSAAFEQKPLKPWPEKLPPYHGTPKRPADGEVLKYADAEEGLIAYKNNDHLRTKSSFSKESLKKKTIEPASAGVAGGTGVYISNSIPEDSPVPNDIFRPDDYFTHYEKPRDPPHHKLRSLYQDINFEYPDLGYSLVQMNAEQQPNLKSVAYTVDCRPRHLLPPMPATYTKEEATTMLNTRYIEMEDSVLRVSRTACAHLVHSKGRGLKQFQLSPAHIHFGTVMVGETIRKTATLFNVSMEKARFHVDIPSPPLKVAYTPCTLAAGMTTKIGIELTALEAGSFVGEIQVKSELNILQLTCSAKIIEPAVSPLDEQYDVVNDGGSSIEAAAHTKGSESS